MEDLADYQIKFENPSRVPTAATLSSPFLRILRRDSSCPDVEHHGEFRCAASVQGSAANAHLWPKPSDGPSPTGPVYGRHRFRKGSYGRPDLQGLRKTLAAKIDKTKRCPPAPRAILPNTSPDPRPAFRSWTRREYGQYHQDHQLLFRSGVVVPGTGIIMNDEMDDFVPAPDRSNRFSPASVRFQA